MNFTADRYVHALMTYLQLGNGDMISRWMATDERMQIVNVKIRDITCIIQTFDIIIISYSTQITLLSV
jgi:hypothetical protein